MTNWLDILLVVGLVLLLASYGLRIYLFRRLRTDLYVGEVIKDRHVLSFADFLSIQLLGTRKKLKRADRFIVDMFIGAQLVGILCVAIFGLSYLAR